MKIGDKVVLISDEEIKAQQPMRDGKMTILEYIEESDVNPIFYESSEYVAADGTAPVQQAFKMLRDALAKTNRVAKGVRVKGGREQYFILRPYGQNGMTMHYLFTDYEVRNCDKWTAVEVNPAMVETMASLIELTTVKFTPAPQDTYMANVRRLINEKAQGAEVSVPTAETEATVSNDLVSALEAALKAAKTRTTTV